jgi:hypothetical protein
VAAAMPVPRISGTAATAENPPSPPADDPPLVLWMILPWMARDTMAQALRYLTAK